MRVHEGDGEVPGLVVVGVRTQPVDRIRGDDRIKEADAPSRPRVMHVVAPKILVVVGGHLRDVLVRKVPFAQVGAVVTLIHEAAADRGYGRVKSRMSRERDVVDHSVLGEVDPGVEACPRRRAWRGVCVVPVERQPVGL